MRTGAPVVSGYCKRLGEGRFRVVLEPMLDPERYDSAEALNAAIAATTQRQIRENLDQWCIFRPFWAESAEAQGSVSVENREIAA